MIITETLRPKKVEDDFPIFLSRDIKGSMIHTLSISESKDIKYTQKIIDGSTAFDIDDMYKYYRVHDKWLEDEFNFMHIHEHYGKGTQICMMNTNRDVDHENVSDGYVIDNGIFKETFFYASIMSLYKNVSVLKYDELNKIYFLKYSENIGKPDFEEKFAVDNSYLLRRFKELFLEFYEVLDNKGRLLVTQDELIKHEQTNKHIIMFDPNNEEHQKHPEDFGINKNHTHNFELGKNVKILDLKKIALKDHDHYELAFKIKTKKFKYLDNGSTINKIITRVYNISEKYKEQAEEFKKIGKSKFEEKYSDNVYFERLKDKETTKVYFKINYIQKNHEHDEEYALIGHSHDQYALLGHEHDEFIKDDGRVEYPFRGCLLSFYSTRDPFDNTHFRTYFQSINKIDLRTIKEDPEFRNEVYSMKIITIFDLAVLKEVVGKLNRIRMIFEDRPYNTKFKYFTFNKESEFIEKYKDTMPLVSTFEIDENRYMYFEMDLSFDYYTSRMDEIEFSIEDLSNEVLIPIDDKFTDLSKYYYINKMKVNSYTGTEKRNIINSRFDHEIFINNNEGSFDAVSRESYNMDRDNGGMCEYLFKYRSHSKEHLRFRVETNGSYLFEINGKPVSGNPLLSYTNEKKMFDYESIYKSTSSDNKFGWTAVNNSIYLNPDKSLSFNRSNLGYLFKTITGASDPIFGNNPFSIKFAIKRDIELEKYSDQIIFFKNSYDGANGYFEIGLEFDSETKEEFVYVDFTPKNFLILNRKLTRDKITLEQEGVRPDKVSYDYCRFKFKINAVREDWTEFVIRKKEGTLEVIQDNNKLNNITTEMFYFDHDEDDMRKTCYIPFERAKEFLEMTGKNNSSEYYYEEFDIGGSKDGIKHTLRGFSLKDIEIFDKFIEVENIEATYEFDYGFESYKEYDMRIVYKQPVNTSNCIFAVYAAKINDIVYGNNDTDTNEIENFLPWNNENFDIFYNNPINDYVIGEFTEMVPKSIKIEYIRSEDDEPPDYGYADKVIKENNNDEELSDEWIIHLGHKTDPHITAFYNEIGLDREEKDYTIYPTILVMDDEGNVIPYLNLEEINNECTIYGLFYDIEFKDQIINYDEMDVKDRTLVLTFYNRTDEGINKVRINGRAFIMF